MADFNPFAGAAQIAADIRAGKITARDALEAYPSASRSLARISTITPALNSPD